MNALTACRAYLAKVPPAVSGAGGHPATFRAACECVRFGLSDADAMAVLREWNGTHCQPLWAEKELAHKLEDARRKAGGQLRAVRQPRSAAVRVVWKIEPKTPPPHPLITPPTAQERIVTRPTEESRSCRKSVPMVLRPDEPIPGDFVDVLATWLALRNDPRWSSHPQLGARGRLIGWSRTGQPLHSAPRIQERMPRIPR